MGSRRSKKPSLELPKIATHKMLKNHSIMRTRMRKFHTEEDGDPHDMRRHLHQILDRQHQFSIDNEFAKLQSLTRRCAILRRDLVSVQSDLITLNLTVPDR